MAGRDRTCGAPRFRRALYRAELRPHRGRWARLESNQRPLVCKTSALAELSYSPKMDDETDVSSGRSRTMFFKPLANPSALDRRSFRHDRVLRGGALEPDPRALPRKEHAKAHASFTAPKHGESFSLRRGLDSF